MAQRGGDQLPANISHYLKGLEFPVKRADLVQHARSNGAEDDVLNTIREMPDGEYHSMEDVMKGVSDIE